MKNIIKEYNEAEDYVKGINDIEKKLNKSKKLY